MDSARELDGPRPAIQRHADAHDESGYAMVALLVALSVIAVLLSVALPSWRTAAQRERESELIFRGQQYARAIALYQRKYANAFPPNLDLLVDQRFLRRKYKDPMTKDGEFQLLLVGQGLPGQNSPGLDDSARSGSQAGTRQGGAGQLGQQRGAQQSSTGTQSDARGGIMGVVSKSDATSLRVYNGRNKYNQWTFVATEATTRGGGSSGGSQTPAGARGAGSDQQSRQGGTSQQRGGLTQPSGRR